MRAWLLPILAILAAAPRARAADDQQAWQGLDVMVKSTAAPGWVADAAGSIPCELELDGQKVSCRKPGPGGELVGYSPQLEATLEKSIAAARRSAARLVLDLVLWTARQEAELRRADGAVVRAYATSLVDAELPALEAGRFSQEVERPYGTLHRTALLVRADAKAIGDLVGKLERAERDGRLAAFARRRQLFWAAAAAVVLALTAFLLYTLLNAGTRGHFAWPLRIVSLGTLGVVYWVIIYLNGWFP
jgi:hypothetical protein